MRVSLKQSVISGRREFPAGRRDKAKGRYNVFGITHVSELDHPQFAELGDGGVGGLRLQKELAQDHLLAAEETAHGEASTSSEDGASCWPGERLRRTDLTLSLTWSAVSDARSRVVGQPRSLHSLTLTRLLALISHLGARLSPPIRSSSLSEYYK